jgi:hypothetical protein
MRAESPRSLRLPGLTRSPAAQPRCGHRCSPASGAYAITGGSALLPGIMRADGGAYVITLGQYTLARSGGEFDLVYGGIGHYLEEIERAKQLRKITRKTPAPVVHEKWPRLPPPPQPLAQTLQALAYPHRRIARSQETDAAQRQVALIKRRR